MSDQAGTENNTPQENESVAPTGVTDDQLSSAWDTVNATDGMETETDTQTEDQQEKGQEIDAPNTDNQEDTDDHKERSRLGRRMKSLEDSIGQILERLSQPQQPAPVQNTATQPVDYSDNYVIQRIAEAKERGIIPEIITTPEDQWATNRYLAQIEQERTATLNNAYSQGYIRQLESNKGKVDESLHAEIIAELYKDNSPFNVRHSDNPVADARINYAEAKAYILEQKATGNGKNVFKGKQTNLATGVTATTRQKIQADELPPLDETAKEFVRMTGMSEESVRSALKGDLPIHLRGIR